MSFFKNLFRAQRTVDIKSTIEQGAFLVDVREPGEVAQGGVPGAVNIPLGTVPLQLSTFKDKKNIIVFCRSGNRSGQAKTILNQHGFTNVINGGTWEQVKQLVKR